MVCDERVAERQCVLTGDHYSKHCWVETHMFGAQKRRFYFDITYNPDKPEGASTWSQPAMVIPEREDSFQLNEEETVTDEVSSDSSFDRDPRFNAYEAA